MIEWPHVKELVLFANEQEWCMNSGACNFLNDATRSPAVARGVKYAGAVLVISVLADLITQATLFVLEFLWWTLMGLVSHLVLSPVFVILYCLGLRDLVEDQIVSPLLDTFSWRAHCEESWVASKLGTSHAVGGTNAQRQAWRASTKVAMRQIAHEARKKAGEVRFERQELIRLRTESMQNQQGSPVRPPPFPPTLDDTPRPVHRERHQEPPQAARRASPAQREQPRTERPDPPPAAAAPRGMPMNPDGDGDLFGGPPRGRVPQGDRDVFGGPPIRTMPQGPPTPQAGQEEAVVGGLMPPGAQGQGALRQRRGEGSGGGARPRSPSPYPEMGV
uniref:Uncharacterized protein n=1 Tax=Chromera velia CCMP2878 TaxID=1169474 RepID=A0A0G4HF97_9ALVE|eukprot:Cvel_26921.t1-p1 / transcript=Cvel_26921.t1 / gene=Cvel_26921 / organism=Chromera_velia_CCMP2878 / gene_product=hypothetical protein / transcript_product=hypothetical protein / location=Cvel_scaffold3276:3288-6371(+) / protein_length=332 / sequence_SO=supercontig / SO=protein_coding / is_pseudo=false